MKFLTQVFFLCLFHFVLVLDAEAAPIVSKVVSSAVSHIAHF
ncbi:MAG: hypothetical protein ACXWQO_09985 [Bdellovibrionota bacterium]